MPRTLKSVPFFTTAAGAGTAVATVSPGALGSNVIDNYNNGNAYLESVWASGAVADFVRIRSGRLHDAQQGLRLQTGGTQRSNLLPWPNGQKLASGDALVVEIDATGAGSAGLILTYGFDDLSTTNQSLASAADITSRIQEVMYQEVDVTASATIGTVGAGVALNAFQDNWKAGFQYALLGYTLSVAVLGLLLNGANTSGQDIGMPGDTDPRETRDYFLHMANATGRPCIPVIDGNNRASNFLKAVDIAAGTATKATLCLARLG